jgi:hypothetical protein
VAPIKAPDVNWLDEAWRISAVIAAMPDTPPGLLSDVKEWPKLSHGLKLQIDSLQKTIAVQLGYRTSVVHKASFELPTGEKGLFWLNSVDPTGTRRHLALLFKLGVKLESVDLWAFDAHMKLGRILLDRYVCKEWKRELPLIVASIGGATTSQTAKLKARQPRNVDRRSSLALAVAKERRNNPTASAIEVFNRLCGGDVVKEMSNERVHYWDAKGNLKSVGMDRYETIFSEQKPSTG